MKCASCKRLLRYTEANYTACGMCSECAERRIRAIENLYDEAVVRLGRYRRALDEIRYAKHLTLEQCRECARHAVEDDW